jgi:hypothetical protein
VQMRLLVAVGASDSTCVPTVHVVSLPQVRSEVLVGGDDSYSWSVELHDVNDAHTRSDLDVGATNWKVSASTEQRVKSLQIRSELYVGAIVSNEPSLQVESAEQLRLVVNVGAALSYSFAGSQIERR